MLKLVFLLATALYAVNAQVALWGQCGGKDYRGQTNCVSGSSCVYENEWYFQCRPSSQTTTRPPTQPTQASTQPSTTRPSGGSTGGSCKLINGKLNWGRDYQDDNTDYSPYDHITIWMDTIDGNGNTDFNEWYQGAMLKKAKALGKTPVFYAYVIAFEARAKKGIQDCDVNPGYSLCNKGANFIRENEAMLVQRYTHHASNIARIMGRDATVVFKMEPDLWQYYGDAHQEGGPLSGTYMRSLFDKFVAAIKQQLPNACISWDISAWIGQQGFRTWWGFFSNSKDIDFIHTSGGQAHGESSNLKPNELSWSFVSQETGKKILADCGYGVGGGDSGNCWPYQDNNNINNRVRDGVVAVSMVKPNFTPSNRPAV